MILYEGPSLLDPSVPIVVVATEDSNPKTGHMLFTWILRADRPPEVAAYDGSDDAICGNCKFRTQLDSRGWDPDWDDSNQAPPFMRKSRTCYVRLSPAEGADENLPPSEVWRAWKAGEFPSPVPLTKGWGFTDTSIGRCAIYSGPLPVRIGSYGDPAAVPTRVWAELVRYQRHWTGYTHMWNERKCSDCDGKGGRRFKTGLHECRECYGSGFVPGCDPDLKRYCMASVDTPEERAEAQALGWRTFMVVPEEMKIFWFMGVAGGRDILCPATDPHPKRGEVCPQCEGDGWYEGMVSDREQCEKCHGTGRVNTTCATCLLCRGTSAPAPSIWEVVHSKNASNHKW